MAPKHDSDAVRRLRDRIAHLAAKEAQELAAALSMTEDLSLPLLKFHLLAEQLLERIIANQLPRPDRLLNRARFTFVQKLLLVHSLELVQDSAVQALHEVNSLRNKCAHVREKQIVEADIERIGRPLGSEFRELRHRHRNDLRELLVLTLARIAQALIAAVLYPEAEAHLRDESHGQKTTEPAPGEGGMQSNSSAEQSGGSGT